VGKPGLKQPEGTISPLKILEVGRKTIEKVRKEFLLKRNTKRVACESNLVLIPEVGSSGAKRKSAPPSGENAIE